MTFDKPTLRWRTVAAILTQSALALGAASSWAAPTHQHDSDWLIFLSGEGIVREGVDSGGLRESDGLGRADVLLTHTGERFRALMETVVDTGEIDVERFQVGFETSENTLFWFGRFHQPASAWNTEHHHGQYLQTAITRPTVEDWEDDGGIIPQHLLGALFDTRQAIGETGGLRFAVGAGAGSLLNSSGFEPIHVFSSDYKQVESNHGGHKLSWAARLAWMPDFLGPSSAGILVGNHKVRIVDDTLAAAYGTRDLEQSVYGAYLDWDSDVWRVIATAYGLHLRYVGSPSARSENFGAGYVQAEYQLPHALTAFARHENSTKASQSALIALHGDTFNLRRSAVGLRWDLARRQALTIELAHTTTLLDAFSECRLQWSAVVP